jgi:hypothetical protein
MYPRQPGPPPRPKRNNTTLIVVVAVGVPLLLILCCVGTVVIGPTVGFNVYSSSRDRLKEQIKPVAGNWENSNKSVRLVVSPFAGDLSLSFTDPYGWCEGRITKPNGHDFPVVFSKVPCGPSEQPITDPSGRLTLNPQGDQLTLTIPGRADIVLTSSP